MLTISDWAAFKTHQIRNGKPDRTGFPQRKEFPLPKGRKFTSEKFHPGTITLPESGKQVVRKGTNKRGCTACLSFCLWEERACWATRSQRPQVVPGFVYRTHYERAKQPQHPAPPAVSTNTLTFILMATVSV